MQSSFRKYNLGKEPLPVRQVHSLQDMQKPKAEELDAYSVLISLENRLASLEENLVKTYENHFAKGRREGYNEGFAQGREEAADLIEQAAREVKRVHQQRQRHVREHKKQIANLIIAICEQLLLEQVLHQENVDRLVEDAIAALQPPLEAIIYCHPDRVQDINANIDKFSRAAKGRIEIVANPLLEKHVIKVESENSVMEIDLVNELKEIAAELSAELGL